MAYIFSFCLFCLYIRLDKRANSFQIFKNFWKSDWQRLKDVIILGWPISLTTWFEGMLFNAAIILMGLIGVFEAAAYQIALNVAALAFMLPYGMSMAGAVRIGLAEGARNKPATRRAASTRAAPPPLTRVRVRAGSRGKPAPGAVASVETGYGVRPDTRLTRG